MNRGKRQKAAGVWFDLAKYLFLATVVSGLFVRPINWQVVVIGTVFGGMGYLLGLIVEPQDRGE